jgi:hypothetical protein
LSKSCRSFLRTIISNQALLPSPLKLSNNFRRTVGVLERHDAIKAVAQAADVLIDAAIEAV